MVESAATSQTLKPPVLKPASKCALDHGAGGRWQDEIFGSAWWIPLLGAGLTLFVLRHEAWVRELVLLQSRYNAFHPFFCAPLHTFFPLTSSQHDCFFFLPTSLFSASNLVVLSGYFMVLIAIVEAVNLFVFSHRARQGKGWALIALGLAALPWFVLVRLEGPKARLLPVQIALTAILWWFIVWQARLVQRRGMGRRASLVRAVSALLVIGALLFIAAGPLSVLKSPAKLEPLPIRVYDPHQVTCDKGGCWYAETIGDTAGLWRYDGRAKQAASVLRAQGLRSFVLDGSFIYLYDAFEQEVLKFNPTTRQILWRVSFHAGDTVDVVGGRGTLFAVSDDGQLAIFDANGRLRAKRSLPFHAWYPRALPGTRVALIAPGVLELWIVGADPASDIHVPLPQLQLRDRWNAGVDGSVGQIPVLVDMAYADSIHTLYIATLWGEVLRYDLSTQRWASPIRHRPGLRAMAVDDQRGLLWLYSNVGGTLEALALDSGRRLIQVRAPIFGNRLSVAQPARTIMLSARGPGGTSLPELGGVYRLDYQR